MAPRLCCVVLLLACAAVSVSASRQLLQSSTCPAGCGTSTGDCIFDSSANSYKCVRCQNKLVVNTITGTCDVPPGRYATDNDASDCLKGQFCEGGVYVASGSPNYTECTSFSSGLTTIGRRSTSKKACVNDKGYYYSINPTTSDPSATICPVDSYGPGLRKQRACVPCAPGYITNGATGSTVATACVVPAGYFLKAPGQVAPCPMGEYKETTGATTSCTKCPAGVTTNVTGATNHTACDQLVAGYYASTIDADGKISAAVRCPQKFYCPGGAPGTTTFNTSDVASADGTTIIACDNGAWTFGLGSTAVSQCLTPPGYYTTGGATAKCGAGTYRAEWTTPSAASSCTTCGNGISTDEVDQITAYDIASQAPSTVSVSGSAGACYIVAGQGLYYNAAAQSFRAVNCSSNNYGVANTTYGLSASPCRDCPANLVTSGDLSTTYKNGAIGFYSPLACVTQPGYGYNGRASYQCRAGSYNAGNNYAACQECGEGKTTADLAASQVSVSDCLIATGYGYHNSQIQPCPVGTYNNATQSNLTAPCTTCPTGLTTSGTGSNRADQCNLCSAGYGGTDCATQCGGASATYGPAGSDAGTNCTTCPAMTQGFAFDYRGTSVDYAPGSIARSGASTASDCLAEFAQIVDVAWWLNSTATPAASAAAADMTACAATCMGSCMFVTLDYESGGSNCTTYTGGAGTGALAFKAVSYADTAASKLKPSLTKAKAIASGSYTFWTNVDQDSVLTQTADAKDTFADCLEACDADAECAGVSIEVGSPTLATSGETCKLIKGITTLNSWKRSATRAVASQLSLS